MNWRHLQSFRLEHKSSISSIALCYVELPTSIAMISNIQRILAASSSSSDNHTYINIDQKELMKSIECFRNHTKGGFIGGFLFRINVKKVKPFAQPECWDFALMQFLVMYSRVYTYCHLVKAIVINNLIFKINVISI